MRIKSIITLIIFTFSTILFFSCSENPDEINDSMEQKLKLNKKNYSIKIGEKVKIYYTENSCCPVCYPRLNKLVCSKFLGTKTEITRDCIGCDFLYSLNFKGIKKGIDTVLIGITFPLENCDSITDFKNFSTHIIRVN